MIKLVRSEPESQALRARIARGESLVSSALLSVEAQRAAARYGPVALARTRAALNTITLLPIEEMTLQRAAELEPVELRSLDALHLAAAVSLGAGLGDFYCYDARLAIAAAELGLSVAAPA